MKNGGFVYLLKATNEDNVYKIGMTRGKIENRMRNLQTGNSGEIQLYKLYKTDYPVFLEKRLHLHYEDHKLLNEWYILSNEEVNDFENTCKKQEIIIKSLKSNEYITKYLK